MEIHYSINDKIKTLRSLRHYKQSYMASRMGLSQQDYSHLENHGKHITNDQITKICEILEIRENFLERFDPALLFENPEERKNEENTNRHFLNAIGNDDEIVVALKVHVIRLLENMEDLRDRVKEQNETISELRKIISRTRTDLDRRNL